MSTPSTLLTPAEAIQRLGKGGSTLLPQLVAEERLSAFRFPDGSLGFLPADLDSITRPVDPREAAAELIGISSATADSPSTSILEEIRHQFELWRREEAERQWNKSRWMDASQVAMGFGLDKRRLEQWCGHGLIRKAKLGEAQQAKALYAAEDIERTLDGIAKKTIKPPRDAEGTP